MMDFLEKLYSYEYFPQILFTSIAVLLILLVIVILFGKKDEKVRKEEETRRLELAGLDAFAKEENAPISLEVNDINGEQPVNEVVTEIKEQFDIPPVANDIESNTDDDIHSEAEELVKNALNNSIGDSLIEQENNENEMASELIENTESFMIPDFEIFKEEEKNVYHDSYETSEPEIPLSLNELHQKNETTFIARENAQEKSETNLDNTAVLPEFNFDELASSISKELDEINKLQELNKSEEKEEAVMPSKIDVTPIKEVTKFTPSSVFSSVYVNKEREIGPEIKGEPVIKNEEVKPVLEEKNEPEIPVIRNIVDEPLAETKEEITPISTEAPVKPVVTNPFIFDMPAKKEEKKEMPKDEEPKNVNIPDFSSFQNETYDIK
ncbi:MAG: hypothetical protein IJA94_01585 [Bacilli bacterium]|nr:hypothetical protein [Bacilli bacterium]